jgi:hypothetical protein
MGWHHGEGNGGYCGEVRVKWDKPEGSTQRTADGRYCIVQANSQDWIAYLMGYTTAKDLGTRDSDLKARAVCEAHEAQLQAAHRRSA